MPTPDKDDLIEQMLSELRQAQNAGATPPEGSQEAGAQTSSSSSVPSPVVAPLPGYCTCLSISRDPLCVHHGDVDKVVAPLPESQQTETP